MDDDWGPHPMLWEGCLECGGDCKLLGTLGCRHHYRCIQCGAELSTAAPVEDDRESHHDDD